MTELVSRHVADRPIRGANRTASTGCRWRVGSSTLPPSTFVSQDTSRPVVPSVVNRRCACSSDAPPSPGSPTRREPQPVRVAAASSRTGRSNPRKPCRSRTVRGESHRSGRNTPIQLAESGGHRAPSCSSIRREQGPTTEERWPSDGRSMRTGPELLREDSNRNTVG